MTRDQFTAWISESGVVLLDGATGTELERRGFSTNLPLWSASAIWENPELLLSVHKSYVDAGAEIVTANTFRTTRHTFAKAGLSGKQAGEAVQIAVHLARSAAESAEQQVLVAAAIAPLEDCYSPGLVPDTDVIRSEHSHTIEAMYSASPDLILCETMIGIEEIEFLAKSLSDGYIPFLISLTADDNGAILDGTPLRDVCRSIIKYKPAAIMLNCRTPATISINLPILREGYDGVIGCYANGHGSPGGPTGWQWNHSIETLAEYMTGVDRWLDCGAAIVGGCCGTTPAFISGIRTVINGFVDRQ